MGDVRVAAVGSHCSRDLEEEGGNVRSLVQQRSLRGVVHRVDSHAAALVVEAGNGPPVQRNTALVPRTLPLDGRSLPDPSAAPPTPEERWVWEVLDVCRRQGKRGGALVGLSEGGGEGVAWRLVEDRLDRWV